MSRFLPEILGPAAGCAVVLSFFCAEIKGESQEEMKPDFFRDVQPLLSEHCTACHGGVKRKGGISFTNRRDAFLEAKSGAVPVVPGDLEKSELVYRISTEDEDDRMPPEEALGAEEIALLTKWIAEGADWPVHWALQPVEKPKAAAVSGGHPIDRIVSARLKEAGIEPSPEADRRTLIRRLALDLTGLLPTPGEVERYLTDESADAYEEVVNRYMASAHFGERWARHWLDEARYADSAGYEKDSARADAYRWRDWVIEAINEDLPFDEFTVKQVAGDLLPGATREDRLATAFHLMTQFNLEGGVDAEEDRTKRVIDRISTIGSVWLGSTIGCAQCHDHPYDPVTQREFYEFYAFFNNADYEPIFIGEIPDDAEARVIKRYEQWKPIAEMLEAQLTNKSLSNKIQASLSRLRNFDNTNGFTRVVAERAENRRKAYVFRRGDFLQPLKEEGELTPGTPEAWHPLVPRAVAAKKAAAGEKDKEKKAEPVVADRLDLARWLVDPANPLPARVSVNKVWMHLFGAPLAPIPQDFGARGEPPTHPELLDWLAHFFVHEAGWSRKKLIKEIVMSETYRRSSRHRPALGDVDPDNVLLARQNRFRVEAELVRDLHLQAGGLLSLKVGGPSVFPPVPEDVAALSYANNFKWKTSEGEDRYRRGMYTFYKRTAPEPTLVTFDCPDASISNPARDSSNSPLQALATLQNEVFIEAVRSMAKNVLSAGAEDDGARLRAGFITALGRPPVAAEQSRLLRLLKESRDYYAGHTEEAKELAGAYTVASVPPAESAAWVATLRVVLNLDEFIVRG